MSRTAEEARAVAMVREIVRARDSVRPVAFSGSFDTGKRHRMDSRSPAPLGSSNAHRDRWTLDEQIRRCTDALRNNTLFRAIVRTIEDWAVGSAPDIVPTSSDEAFNAAVSEWLDYADGTFQFDGRRMKSLCELASSAMTALACGGRVLMVRAAGGGVLAYEPERIGNPDGHTDRIETDGTSWVGGVHMDALGRAIEFNVYGYDGSGERLLLQGGTRVAASNAIYVIRPSLVELNQVSAEPALQSVLRRIYDVDDNIDNTNWSYYIATLFGVIFSSKDPKQLLDGFYQSMANAASGTGGSGEQLASTSGGTGEDATLEMQRASMLSAPEGTVPVTVAPPAPTQQIEPWTWSMLHLACADVGFPPELVFGRFIRNYSASRGAIAAAWPRVERWQGAARRVISPAYRHTLVAALRAGAVRGVSRIPDDWFKHNVILPQMPSLDPAQEVRTVKEAIDARLMDYDTGVRVLTGQDYRTVHAKLATQIKTLRTLGIEPVQMPGAGGNGQMANGQMANEEQNGKDQSGKDGGAEDKGEESGT